MPPSSHKRLRLIAVLAAATATSTTLAQTSEEPGLNWALDAQTAYDDNVFRTDDDEADDVYLALKPQLAWFGYLGAHQFDIAATGDFRRYANEDVLDYSAWALRAHAMLDHSARLNTDYVLGYENGVQPPGQVNQVFVPGQSPNEFERLNAGWTITYGAAEAAGQLVGALTYLEQEFTNNNQEFRNTNNTGLRGTFFYRIAPRTRLLAEIDYTDFDFQAQDFLGRDQSGEQFRYLGGVTWEATANTTGEFRIGYRDRSFDAEGFNDLSGLALSLDMTWQPNELTTVRVGAAEENQDAAIQGAGGQVRRGIDISASRAISARTRLVADLRYDEFEFEGFGGRSDKRREFGLGLERDMLPRLAARLEYRFEERSSDVGFFEYQANVVLLTLTFTPPQ